MKVDETTGSKADAEATKNLRIVEDNSEVKTGGGGNDGSGINSKPL